MEQFFWCAHHFLCTRAHTEHILPSRCTCNAHFSPFFFVICAHFGAIMNKIRCLKSNLCDVRKLKIYCRHVWCIVTQHIACMIALTAPTASVICAFFFWLMFETSGVHSTWTFPHEQSKVGSQRCEKWQTLDTESATNFWMTFIMQAQRPSELNMLSTRRNINILIILFWCVLGVLYATEKLKYSELIRQRWREIETNTKKTNRGIERRVFGERMSRKKNSK